MARKLRTRARNSLRSSYNYTDPRAATSRIFDEKMIEQYFYERDIHLYTDEHVIDSKY